MEISGMLIWATVLVSLIVFIVLLVKAFKSWGVVHTILLTVLFIEAWTFLFYIRGSEVDGGFAHRKLEPGVREGSRDAVARLLHGCVWKTDDDDHCFAKAGINFYLDRVSLDPADGRRINPG